ncbi:hypothetical protein AHAS_Ahas16G0086600 [Arachis hypogaea]
MHAELWAIIKGLQIAAANGMNDVIIESDSQMAIKLVREGCPLSHPCYPLLQDISILVRRIHHMSMRHTLREANVCVDVMAKKGHQLGFGLHLFDHPIPEIYLPMLFDCAGYYRLRGSA